MLLNNTAVAFNTFNDKRKLPLALIFAYEHLELNETFNGKKSFGTDCGALNSKEPDLLLASINGKDHTN